MDGGPEGSPERSVCEVHCEWGTGIDYVLPGSDVVVIVDVLSFSTAVDIATARGALIYPCRPEGDPLAYARRLGAECARPGRHGTAGYSLSPASLLEIPAGTKLVLPSPNGSALSYAVGRTPAFCGCLRNATAVAGAVASAVAKAVSSAAMGAMAGGAAPAAADARDQRCGRVTVIAAGERWPGGGLRPALEDLIGAGAIISHLPGKRTPEAETAAMAFTRYKKRLFEVLAAIPSGMELLDRGFEEDVRLAADLDVSANAPVLDGLAYVSQPPA